MKRVIGFDLDDVLMDFNEWLCFFHNTRYDSRLKKEDITSYFLEEIWQVSRDETIRRVHEFYHSIHHRMAQPVPGAVQAIQQLQIDYKVVVITSRAENVSAQTHAWIENHFPSLAGSVHHATHSFFHAEGSGTKGELCKKLGVEVFVDDAFHHIEEIAPKVKHVLLFDAPWNRACTSIPQNARRVYSWDEICSFLKTP